MTGGTSPIGMETARELARSGAAVTLAVNDLATGGRASPGEGQRVLEPLAGVLGPDAA